MKPLPIEKELAKAIITLSDAYTSANVLQEQCDKVTDEQTYVLGLPSIKETASKIEDLLTRVLNVDRLVDAKQATKVSQNMKGLERNLALIQTAQFGELHKVSRSIYSSIYSMMHTIEDRRRSIALHGLKPSTSFESKEGEKGDWKSDLSKAADYLLDPTKYAKQHGLIPPDQDDNAQKLIDETAKLKIRILSVDEPFGIVQIPVILTDYRFTDWGWDSLTKFGYDMENVHGHYLLIQNCFLLGVVETLPGYLGKDILTVMAKSLSTLQKMGVAQAKGVGLTGEIKRRGSHYYAVIAPAKLIDNEDVQVKQWDFSNGVPHASPGPKHPNIDIGKVTEEEIEKSKDVDKMHIPETEE
jgi:hypothetical protein